MGTKRPKPFPQGQDAMLEKDSSCVLSFHQWNMWGNVPQCKYSDTDWQWQDSKYVDTELVIQFDQGGLKSFKVKREGQYDR